MANIPALENSRGLGFRAKSFYAAASNLAVDSPTNRNYLGVSEKRGT